MVIAALWMKLCLLGGIAGDVTDCNRNRIDDEIDISACYLYPACGDCDGNGVLDVCQIRADSKAPGGPFFCDPESPPPSLGACDADCNGNGLPDACDLNRYDCNSDEMIDSCAGTDGRFYSADVYLIAYFGGYIGFEVARSEFDFGMEFARIDAAWLRIGLAEGLGIRALLIGCIDDVCNDDAILSFEGDELCVRLDASRASLSGIGEVSLEVYPECCDLQVLVDHSVLWFDGVPMPSPTSLREFAEMQSCFARELGETHDAKCTSLDFDHDGIVNAEDYLILLVALAGPQ